MWYISIILLIVVIILLNIFVLFRKKQLQEVFEENEERSRLIFETIPDAISINRFSDGLFVDINQGFMRFSGYSKKELHGKSPLKIGIWKNKEDHAKFISELKNSGSVTNSKIEFRLKDGSIRTGLLTAGQIKLNREWHVLTIIRDISELIESEVENKKLQKQLIQSQKMEAVGTLAGGIAHDFNNRLHTVTGYSQLLLIDKEKNDPAYEMLKEIELSARKASELTDQLLTFSKKVDTKLKPTDLNYEVMNVKKLLRRTIPQMIQIELNLSPELKTVHVDPNQIEQVILNLGINAGHAMPDGGQLVIETKNVILDEEYCRTHIEITPAEYVELTVADSGHGMEKDILDHIFEPFFTTKGSKKGTGLGLSMVYGIVKNHNGHITCYSQPDQGTVFKIYLPILSRNYEEKSNETITVQNIPDGQETILLVDDEDAIIDIGRRMLERFGYKPIIARNGESAIEVYESDKDKIDLVILDISMPGMGGLKCLKKLISMAPDIKILIASGYAVNQQVKKALDSGAAGFISKPFRIDDFLINVRAALDNA